MSKRSVLSIDSRINYELENVIHNIEVVTGLRYTRPKAVRFLINHYDATKEKTRIKRKPRNKEELIFY